MTVEIQMQDAPAFIAALVRQGVTFKAYQRDDVLHITMTGGY